MDNHYKRQAASFWIALILFGTAALVLAW